MPPPLGSSPPARGMLAEPGGISLLLLPFSGLEEKSTPWCGTPLGRGLQ